MAPSQNPDYPDYHETDPEDMRVDPAFDNDSRWPRRLLHISTLKSYPWRRGNVYGGKKEPRYFAITYTWGRWQLAADSHPSLKSLDFGTPWPIPRVDPTRFTPEDFVNLIQSLPVHPPRPNRLRAAYVEEVEFVWLDVACIDQRTGSREKELEIGRQAAIFSGAHQVFAWLHRFGNSEAQEYYQEFREGYSILLSCLKDMKELQLDEQKNVLRELGTMESRIHRQETRMMASKAWAKVSARIGFLRKKISERPPNPELLELEERAQRLLQLAETSAMFQSSTKKRPKPGPVQKVQEMVSDVKKLSMLIEDLKQSIHLMIDAAEKFSSEPWFSSLWTLQEGYLRPDAFLRDRNGEPWIYTRSEARLFDFVELFHELSETLASSIIVDTPAADELRSRIGRSGCLELKSKLPTILLKASQNRTVNPAYVNDRVYGIMQVFGFKLGRAAPDCPPDAQYSLDDLEDQLGAALLSQSPIMSQMFFHTQPAPAGKGWRMSAHVDIPKLAGMMNAYLNAPYSKVESTAELSVTNTGRANVGHFSGMVCNLETLHRIWTRWNYAGDEVRMDFDTVDFSDKSQYVSEVEALMLGIFRYDQRPGSVARLPTTVVCLLLFPSVDKSRITEWRRRGLCFWSLEDPFLRSLNLSNEESDLMHGRGSHWKHRSGTFG
ncbi:hypothetical protein BU26DRAFT_515204 [Trematosphaeria pertusa]|uniref:Heterokaryon incompatibility domain-containing protein n=1 Tax=Trematosphaeria pertusa TaxID=390896 RepID=A0A6A6ISD0_9PLEO|nr:uncharacterized protein BU26DRAFT_515204 [Trematosphaeria pertusa]KAF2252742.1 hypothetical protein BU26DRAFT_515204 [Trematosphaeria pertusa]